MTGRPSEPPVAEYGCIDCGSVSFIPEALGWLFLVLPLGMLIMQIFLVRFSLLRIRNGGLKALAVFFLVFAVPCLCWLIILNIAGGGILEVFAIIISVVSILGAWVGYIGYAVARNKAPE